MASGMGTGDFKALSYFPFPEPHPLARASCEARRRHLRPAPPQVTSLHASFPWPRQPAGREVS